MEFLTVLLTRAAATASCRQRKGKVMATDDSDIDSTYPFTSFNFLVSLTLAQPGLPGTATPLCNGEFTECDGLDMTIEPKTYREGGNNTRQIHLVGPVTYGNLSLKRGMTANQDLWKWFNAAAGNPVRPGAARIARGSGKS